DFRSDDVLAQQVDVEMAIVIGDDAVHRQVEDAVFSIEKLRPDDLVALECFLRRIQSEGPDVTVATKSLDFFLGQSKVRHDFLTQRNRFGHWNRSPPSLRSTATTSSGGSEREAEAALRASIEDRRR